MSDLGGRARRFLLRTIAMARKETFHIQRDPRTLYMALVMPIVMIVLFGLAVSFDLDHVPIAVVDADRTAASRAIVRALSSSEELVVAATADDASEIQRLFARRRVIAAVVLPRGTGRAIAEGRDAPIQIVVDGSDGTTASSVLGTSGALVRTEARRLIEAAAGVAVVEPLAARVRLLYNPALRSAVFLVPGLMVYVLAIGAVLLTALTVAREWERGNMELLFATPVSRLEVILGKLSPYLAIGFVQSLLVLVLGTTAFDVPLRGSVLHLLAASILFLIGTLGQGLLISVVAKNQQVATQAGALSSLLPSLLLSGFLFPIENMPVLLQGFSAIFPARYFVAILRGVMLKGSGLGLLWPHYLALAIYALVTVALATARFKRTLE